MNNLNQLNQTTKIEDVHKSFGTVLALSTRLWNGARGRILFQGVLAPEDSSMKGYPGGLSSTPPSLPAECQFQFPGSIPQSLTQIIMWTSDCLNMGLWIWYSVGFWVLTEVLRAGWWGGPAVRHIAAQYAVSCSLNNRPCPSSWVNNRGCQPVSGLGFSKQKKENDRWLLWV